MQHFSGHSTANGRALTNDPHIQAGVPATMSESSLRNIRIASAAVCTR